MTGDWESVALVAGREAFGPDVVVQASMRQTGRVGYVAWAEDELGIVLAIGGGATEQEACRRLTENIVSYRHDGYLSTAEVATVAGVCRQRVEQWVAAGRLRPANVSGPARFLPAEIARFVLGAKRERARTSTIKQE